MSPNLSSANILNRAGDDATLNSVKYNFVKFFRVKNSDKDAIFPCLILRT